MDAPKLTSRLHPLSSVKGRIIVGFSLLVVVLVAVVAGSAWQAREHRFDTAAMEEHADTAFVLQDAQVNAEAAAASLQRYVAVGDETRVTGDEIILPEVRSQMASAQQSIAQALADAERRGDREQAATLYQISAEGDSIVAGAEMIIALRQSGDAQTAVAALEAKVLPFREFESKLDAAAKAELEEVSRLRGQADTAGELALRVLIISGAIGAVLGLATSVFVARSILKPLSSLESTARAVAAGNLDARSNATGPRELEHLGETLNIMIATVQQRTEALRLAHEESEERYHQLVDARAEAAADALTGLGNHRAFHLRIREEIDQAAEAGVPVGLIMLDIDGFKGFNDSRGHLAGDEILRGVARSLTSVVGREDVYRYGGDEFAVIVTGGDRRKTAGIAEALRRAVVSEADGGDGKVTISLGIASFPKVSSSSEELVYGADAAMYWAKSAGKNRVGD